MKVIVFSPLGWNSYIWSQVLLPGDTVYIDFDQSGYQETMSNCIDLFKGLDEQCIIITSSYGTQFFLQLFSKIDQKNISKIYMLDGLETIDKSSVEQITQNRLDRFDSKDDYLNYYLDEIDKQDDFKVSLIDSLFRNAEDEFKHILDNETFIDYLLNIHICPTDVIKTIICDMTIYSSIDLDYPHVKITPQEHLVMLERCDIMEMIQEEINVLCSQVKLTNK